MEPNGFEISIELIIALIGAITGSVSLLVQFFDYLRNSPKLSVKLDDDRSSFYFLNPDDGIDISDTNRHASAVYVVNFEIRNKRSSPVTIQKIMFSIKNLELYSDDNALDEVLVVNTYKKGVMEVNRMIKLNMPFEGKYRIDGYDSANFRVTYLDYSENTSSNKKVRFKLKAITPRKNFTLKDSLTRFRK